MTRASKPAPTAPATKPDPDRLIRMVGQRDEVIDVPLTEGELDEQKNLYMELENQKADIEAKKKSANDAFKSELSAIATRKKAALDLNNKRRRSTTITVQEWLNGKNEIIRIRADTKEPIGNVRKARADELQEALFPDNEKPGETVDNDPFAMDDR